MLELVKTYNMIVHVVLGHTLSRCHSRGFFGIDYYYRLLSIQLDHTGMATTTVYSNYCEPVLPNQPPELSLWEETGIPRENPRLSAER